MPSYPFLCPTYDGYPFRALSVLTQMYTYLHRREEGQCGAGRGGACAAGRCGHPHERGTGKKKEIIYLSHFYWSLLTSSHLVSSCRISINILFIYLYTTTYPILSCFDSSHLAAFLICTMRCHAMQCGLFLVLAPRSLALAQHN